MRLFTHGIHKNTDICASRSAVGRGKTMSFKQFCKVMEAQLTHGVSKPDVLAAFKEFSEGKPKISETTVTCHFANEPRVLEYMKTHMIDGDYAAFTNDIFTR